MYECPQTVFFCVDFVQERYITSSTQIVNPWTDHTKKLDNVFVGWCSLDNSAFEILCTTTDLVFFGRNSNQIMDL
jgi:hypothetical protein